MKIQVMSGIMAIAILGTCASVRADDEALSKQTTAQCSVTAKDGAPTPQVIMQKVNEATELLAKKGVAAFADFQGTDSKFIFNGTYIWIHDMEGVMRMHPIKYKLNGKRILSLKDRNGKMFFFEMNNEAKANPDGAWVTYVWPKPGAKDVSPKISFVKLVKTDGGDLVVGCGIYDMTMEDVKKALK